MKLLQTTLLTAALSIGSMAFGGGEAGPAGRPANLVEESECPICMTIPGEGNTLVTTPCCQQKLCRECLERQSHYEDPMFHENVAISRRCPFCKGNPFTTPRPSALQDPVQPAVTPQPTTAAQPAASLPVFQIADAFDFLQNNRTNFDQETAEEFEAILRDMQYYRGLYGQPPIQLNLPYAITNIQETRSTWQNWKEAERQREEEVRRTLEENRRAAQQRARQTTQQPAPTPRPVVVPPAPAPQPVVQPIVTIPQPIAVQPVPATVISKLQAAVNSIRVSATGAVQVGRNAKIDINLGTLCREHRLLDENQLSALEHAINGFNASGAQAKQAHGVTLRNLLVTALANAQARH